MTEEFETKTGPGKYIDEDTELEGYDFFDLQFHGMTTGVSDADGFSAILFRNDDEKKILIVSPAALEALSKRPRFTRNNMVSF